jgi:hypothetical protein
VGQLERDRLFAVQRPRLSNEMNRRGDACEGLVQFDKTGVSVTFHAVREPCAAKVACTVLRGPCCREAVGLPSVRHVSPSAARYAACSRR